MLVNPVERAFIAAFIVRHAAFESIKCAIKCVMKGHPNDVRTFALIRDKGGADAITCAHENHSYLRPSRGTPASRDDL